MTTKIQEGKILIKEFEEMKNLAELKTLSKYSLENPLNSTQFKKMMELKKQILKDYGGSW